MLLIFNPLGTPGNTAIQKYMNSKKVPQLFVATGATKWNDPKNFPWTMGWQPSYQSESHIYAKYLLKDKPDAKIAVLYQNDDYGKDYLKGLKDGLGAKAASMIIAEESYETTEPSIDNHIVKLKATGANVFVNIATPKFAAQAIKKVNEIDWKPVQILNNVSASVGGVMKPAGFDNSQGIISAAYLKDVSDPQWNNDPGMKQFLDFIAKDFPEADRTDGNVLYGYAVAQTMVQVLKQCGDDLTRENIMRQAANRRTSAPRCCCRASRSTARRPTSRRSTSCSSCVSRASAGICSVTSSRPTSAADRFRRCIAIYLRGRGSQGCSFPTIGC